jgi:hypothetical protein
MKPVFLVYKDGRAYRTTDYWFDSDQLVYLAAVGTRLKLPIQALGLDTTAKLNREHGLDSRFLQKTNGGTEGTIQIEVMEIGYRVLVNQTWSGGDGSMTGTNVITTIPFKNIGKSICALRHSGRRHVDHSH